MRVVLALLLLLLTGCSSPDLDHFTDADREALRALALSPPVPTSLSALARQTTGHLNQLLTRRTWIGAQGYLDAITRGELATLHRRAALIVLEHRHTHVAAGILVLLFEPDGTQDIFQVEYLMEEQFRGNRALDLAIPVKAVSRIPHQWYHPDGDADLVSDAYYFLNLERQGDLVGPDGEGQYEWRWGEA